MSAAEFDVSYVVSVYNKSSMLPRVLDSLAAQRGDFSIEHIFVDDASTDDSLKVLSAGTAGWPNVTILENADNAGPSIRINQGARRARGRYLCLFDADDVLAPDAITTMMGLLERHDADFVHGKKRKAAALPEGAVGMIGPEPRHRVSDVPLDTVLRRGFVRMTWLVRRTLFERASGCDERIFVQDEALRLRLGLHARRFVDLREIVNHASTAGEHLSNNLAQQRHDGFLAHHLFARDEPPITEKQRRAIYQRCLSMAWKSLRGDRMSAFKLRVFARYALNRLRRGPPDDRVVRELVDYFREMPGVRRCAQSGDRAENHPDSIRIFGRRAGIL